MSDDVTIQTVWDRECAFAVLAGRQLCPRHGMPCWVCVLLHILTGTIRSVTEGCFDRFDTRSLFTWAEDRTGSFEKACASPLLACPHHPANGAVAYAPLAPAKAWMYWYHDVPEA